jgi:hypothetical protein
LTSAAAACIAGRVIRARKPPATTGASEALPARETDSAYAARFVHGPGKDGLGRSAPPRPLSLLVCSTSSPQSSGLFHLVPSVYWSAPPRSLSLLVCSTSPPPPPPGILYSTGQTRPAAPTAASSPFQPAPPPPADASRPCIDCRTPQRGAAERRRRGTPQRDTAERRRRETPPQRGAA